MKVQHFPPSSQSLQESLKVVSWVLSFTPCTQLIFPSTLPLSFADDQDILSTHSNLRYELWGSTKPSNISRIQSEILRSIECAPFHIDFQIPFVKQVSIDRYDKFHCRTILHPNPLIQSLSTRQLLDNPNRRLRRQRPRDLLHHLSSD